MTNSGCMKSCWKPTRSLIDDRVLTRVHVRDRVGSQQLFMHPEFVIRFVHVLPMVQRQAGIGCPAAGGVRDPHGRVTRWRSPKQPDRPARAGQRRRGAYLRLAVAGRGVWTICWRLLTGRGVVAAGRVGDAGVMAR